MTNPFSDFSPDPLGVIAWVLIALVARTVAGDVGKEGEHGILGDTAAALAGALAGGCLFALLLGGPAGFWGSLAAAALGAGASIAALRAALPAAARPHAPRQAPVPSGARAIAFDVDRDSMGTLRASLPGWEVQAAEGVTPATLALARSPAQAGLLVVGGRGGEAETLGMCRGLRGQRGREATPLLVLLGPEQGALAGAALEAGADSCLLLPVKAGDLAGVLARARAGDRPGRHTHCLDRPQPADRWRDEGGEG